MFYYGLDDGGWINLCYAGATDFEIIKVLDKEQNEISFPTPSVTFGIGWQIAEQQPLDYSSDPEFSNFERFHYTEVDLKISNITDNRKVVLSFVLALFLVIIFKSFIEYF